MKKERNIPLLLILLIVTMYSCNNSSSSGNTPSDNAPVANGSEPSRMMESPGATVDVNAKSNDKGIGRFDHVKLDPLNEAMAAKGEKLFEVNCSACHKTTGDRLVGPGLKGITTIRTPEWIMNMVTNPAEMTQKDPIAKALLEEYLTQMSVSISDEDARSILEFLRKNDGEK